MNSLWQKIQRTVYRPEFFGARVFEAKKGLRFYSFLLLFFIALKVLFALPAMVHFYQAILSDAWQEQQAVITNLFPDELVLTVKDGIFSTNVNEPYAIAVPQEWRTADEATPRNFLVINTKKPIEIQDFVQAETVIIISETSFGFRNPQSNELRIFDFDKKDWIEPASLDKNQFAEFVSYTANIIWWILVIGCIALPFIVYLVLWVSYLVYLVFGALIVWGGAKWRGHQITYGDAYVAGMYLLPIPFAYEFLSSYGQGLAGNIIFAFSILLFVMTLVNFRKVAPEKEKTDTDVTMSVARPSGVSDTPDQGSGDTSQK